jgi:hypothetical protein
VITWWDPLVLGAVVLSALLLAKGVHFLWREVERRRHSRLVEERDVRILLIDYRARYGAHEALKRLKEDLELSRARVEELAAKWKASQKLAEETISGREGRSVVEEERKAYQAFLVEAKRQQQLRRAHEQFGR